MIKKLLLVSAVFVGMLGLSLRLVPATASAAADPKTDVCKGVELTGGSCDTPTGGGATIQSTIANVINIFSIVVGVTAVVMIIIGGFKYITSSGDSGNVNSAKDTILYAIIGLVIVALAQVIVRFVVNKATKAG